MKHDKHTDLLKNNFLQVQKKKPGCVLALFLISLSCPNECCATGQWLMSVLHQTSNSCISKYSFISIKLIFSCDPVIISSSKEAGGWMSWGSNVFQSELCECCGGQSNLSRNLRCPGYSGSVCVWKVTMLINNWSEPGCSQRLGLVTLACFRGMTRIPIRLPINHLKEQFHVLVNELESNQQINSDQSTLQNHKILLSICLVSGGNILVHWR